MIVCSNVFSQKIELFHADAESIRVLNSDTLFVFDRKYGEYIASKFDSLDYITAKYGECSQIIEEQQSLITDYKDFLLIKDEMIQNKKIESEMLYQQIESYKRVEVINNDIQKKLKQASRKKNLWKILAITGFSTTLTTFSIIILK